MAMRVLVTGAYGLIGSACLARLRRDGHALDRRRPIDRGGATAFSLCALDRGRLCAADGRRGLAPAARWHRRGGELRRRAAGRRARRYAARPCAGDRRAVRRLCPHGHPPRRPCLGHRRRARGLDRLLPHQGGGRGAPAPTRPRLDDPAPGARAGARGLWRHRHAARTCRVAVGDAADRPGKPHPGREHRRCGGHRRLRACPRRARAGELGAGASASAQPRRDRRGDAALARISAATAGPSPGRCRSGGDHGGRCAGLARLAQPRPLDRDRPARRRA